MEAVNLKTQTFTKCLKYIIEYFVGNLRRYSDRIYNLDLWE